jgi:phenylalanyl-tRNA synthetase alpha chain
MLFMQIKIESPEEKALKAELANRTDNEAERIKRYLAMPDLSRTEGSPLNEIVKRILAMPDYQNFDTIEVPEIVRADMSFDLFDFPKDHPARSKSDTYYVNEEHILRTHTTVMWNYYLAQESVKERMAKDEPVGSFSYGKVYRKDEVDRNHMNVFHQIDGWYLSPKDKEVIGKPELEKVLTDIAKAVFGPDVKYRFNPDTFPYTDPSLEMEVEVGGRWVEILGAGVVKGKVLENHRVDSSKWNGWAFGFGLERLAIISMELPDIRLLWSEDERVKSQMKLGTKFKEVSKFPSVLRDISFVVPKSFTPNDYFDLIREVGGEMVENVELIDKYENDQKFGSDKMSYTYRITYRHLEKTLTNEEVNAVHAKLEERTENEFNGEVRRV